MWNPFKISKTNGIDVEKRLRDKIMELEKKWDNYTSCQDCGCLIEKSNTIKSNPKIVTSGGAAFGPVKHRIVIEERCRRCHLPKQNIDMSVPIFDFGGIKSKLEEYKKEAEDAVKEAKLKAWIRDYIKIELDLRLKPTPKPKGKK